MRVVGACSEGSESAKIRTLPQRARCGFFPCCTRATHALKPATYEPGSFDRLKANAVRLWQLRGPMASRTYAAVYFNQLQYIPSGWNWIATKRETMLPPASDSATLRTSDTTGRSDSELALGEARSTRPTPISPSPAPSGCYRPTKARRSGKAPPPICRESPSAPPKAICPAYPSSFRKSAWGGDWKLTTEGKWKWKGKRT